MVERSLASPAFRRHRILARLSVVLAGGFTHPRRRGRLRRRRTTPPNARRHDAKTAARSTWLRAAVLILDTAADVLT